jgi:hypothetical protein
MVRRNMTVLDIATVSSRETGALDFLSIRLWFTIKRVPNPTLTGSKGYRQEHKYEFGPHRTID